MQTVRKLLWTNKALQPKEIQPFKIWIDKKILYCRGSSSNIHTPP